MWTVIIPGKHEERFKHSVSPFSMDSESTEVLIMASEDGFHKTAQTHILGKHALLNITYSITY